MAIVCISSLCHASWAYVNRALNTEKQTDTVQVKR